MKLNEKIEIIINRKKYTLEQAKELYKELDLLFGGDKIIPYPVLYPETFSTQLKPYEPLITYTDGTIGLKQ